MVLLKSALPKGVCYVETKNLDGETNLKIKSAHKELYSYFEKESDLMHGYTRPFITCEKPNNAIYKFEGTCKKVWEMKYERGELVSEDFPLNADNLILRGSSLKNTEYVWGVCVFSGHDTKVMQNSANAKYKFSSLEIHMNKAMV